MAECRAGASLRTTAGAPKVLAEAERVGGALATCGLAGRRRDADVGRVRAGLACAFAGCLPGDAGLVIGCGFSCAGRERGRGEACLGAGAGAAGAGAAGAGATTGAGVGEVALVCSSTPPFEFTTRVRSTRRALRSSISFTSRLLASISATNNSSVVSFGLEPSNFLAGPLLSGEGARGEILFTDGLVVLPTKPGVAGRRPSLATGLTTLPP